MGDKWKEEHPCQKRITAASLRQLFFKEEKMKQFCTHCADTNILYLLKTK
jgi:hypothetical protein